MIEQILIALCLGPLDAFRGGQLRRLSHKLPPKTPTVLYGFGVAAMLGIPWEGTIVDYAPALDWLFQQFAHSFTGEVAFYTPYQTLLFVLMFVFGEATGWTHALARACCMEPDGDLSKWERLLGAERIARHPNFAMFIRGAIWGIFLLAITPIVPVAIHAAVGILVATWLAPILGRYIIRRLAADTQPGTDCWKIQEWCRGWILGLCRIVW